MSYAKKTKSLAKKGAALVLADAFACIRAVAVASSAIDSDVLRLAREGVKAASDCLVAETNPNKFGVEKAAHDLTKLARDLSALAIEHAATPSAMVRAAGNMGAALREYRASAYGESCRFAINAMDNVR